MKVSFESAVVGAGVALFGSGIVAALAASAGLFRVVAPLLLAAWACGVLVAVLFFARGVRVSWDVHDVVATGLVVLSAVLSGVLAHDFIGAQSDQGFYVNDATIIASTGGRTIDGPYVGMLPGFMQTSHGWQVSAMFGYPSLAAVFVYLGGVGAVGWVNAPFAMVAGLSMYAVARRLGSGVGAVTFLVFYELAFVSFWLGRYVMTENAATAVWWAGALLALRIWEKPMALDVGGLAVGSAYGSLVRPEGAGLAVWVGVVLLVRHRAVVWGAVRRYRVGLGVAAGAMVGALVLVWRALPVPYILGVYRRGLDLVQGRALSDGVDVPTTGVGPNWGDYAWRYEWDSVSGYAFPFFLLVGLVGLGFGFVRRKPLAVVGLLAVPQLLWVLMPPVTTNHPWYLRRLWVVLIPLVLVVACLSLDLKQVSRRWPRTRGTRTLPTLAATAVLVGLALVHVDIAVPFILRNESDTIMELLPRIHAKLKPGSTVIVDEDVVRFASPLRLQYGVDVVTWSYWEGVKKEAFRESILAEGPVYVLKLNWTAPVALHTDPGGFVSRYDDEARARFPARTDFRQYISQPPLEKGYRPIQSYLDRDVPPRRWVENQFKVTLLELASPIVLMKAITAKPGDWNRTGEGLVAQRDAALIVELSLFWDRVLETVPLALFVCHPGAAPALKVDGDTLPATNTTTKGGLSFTEYPLPTPMNMTRIQAPAGTIIRGLFLGSA